MECTFTGSVSGAGDGVTANVGGIVGANGYNSTVKANTIGSADTVVHGGMVDGTAYETARANAGGIVGTNYGTVSLTDNSQKEEGNTTIDNYLGYTGGIVGCNQKDAVVKGTATEQIITAGTWHVTAKVAGEIRLWVALSDIRCLARIWSTLRIMQKLRRLRPEISRLVALLDRWRIRPVMR